MVKYYLSLCLFVKNERYLEEFITYYKILGIEHFYIYDNESTIPIKDRLSNNFYSEYITFIDFPGLYQQLNAYNDCLEKYGCETEWLIVVDSDEYILPKKHWTIRHFLNFYEDYAAIGINWVIFGSNSNYHRPNGYLIENYTKCNKSQDDQLKCIIKPYRCSKFITVHHPEVYNNNLFINAKKDILTWFRTDIDCTNIIQINHYRNKSFQDTIEKHQRGYADPHTIGAKPSLYSNLHNLDNDIIDTLIKDRYLDHIKSFNIKPLNISNLNIIISRYNENIEWSKQFLNIIIYNKGTKLDDSYYQINIKNVGREAHTFYKYIYDNYDNLNNYTAFLQGNPFDHSPNIINNLNNYIKNINLDINFNINFEFLSETILNSNLSGCFHHKNLPLIEVYEKIFNEKKENMEFEFGIGGQFIVSKVQILKKSKDFYLKIIKLLDYDIDPIEGYIIEKFHKLIFS